MKWVKSYNPDGTVTYFRSVEECCRVFGIKYHETLTRLIDNAQLHEDGKTFFDYPTKVEIDEIKRKYPNRDIRYITEDRIAVNKGENDDNKMCILRQDHTERC